MNAGAYGGEFKDIVISTTFLDKELKLHTISNEEHKFSYRNSVFSTNDNIIISCTLQLERKNNIIPAEIIDKCGLKGYNINGAEVSVLHSGFIVNQGNATAADVLKLIEHIQETVKAKYNESLELEIKVIGE